jgi:thiamine-phosphate pyrophosphorylase
MLLYYITDRKQFPGTDRCQYRTLLDRIAGAAAAGVEYIQLREKDLSAKKLELLAGEAVKAVRDHGADTRLLINSRIDVALAVGADGVHLTSTDISPSDARAIWESSISADSARLQSSSVIGVSCHSPAEVRLAGSHGADFVVLAPVFEKAGTNSPAIGLEALRHATRERQLPDVQVEAGDQRGVTPVFALGGITVANALECIRAGAVGIAGIRIFQEGNLAETVRALRERV